VVIFNISRGQGRGEKRDSRRRGAKQVESAGEKRGETSRRGNYQRVGASLWKERERASSRPEKKNAGLGKTPLRTRKDVRRVCSRVEDPLEGDRKRAFKNTLLSSLLTIGLVKSNYPQREKKFEVPQGKGRDGKKR